MIDETSRTVEIFLLNPQNTSICRHMKLPMSMAFIHACIYKTTTTDDEKKKRTLRFQSADDTEAQKPYIYGWAVPWGLCHLCLWPHNASCPEMPWYGLCLYYSRTQCVFQTLTLPLTGIVCIKQRGTVCNCIWTSSSNSFYFFIELRKWNRLTVHLIHNY